MLGHMHSLLELAGLQSRGSQIVLRKYHAMISDIMRGAKEGYLPKHILLGDLAILKEELAGVAAAHAQLIQLLRRLEALHVHSMGPPCPTTVSCSITDQFMQPSESSAFALGWRSHAEHIFLRDCLTWA